MALDPSIPLQITVPTPVNPLDTIGKALQIRSAQNQNALFQGQQAAGQAFQNSLNPDGTTNQGQFLQNLAANPSSAPAALEAARGGQALSQAEYDQHVKRLTYINNSAMGLLAQYPNGVPQDAVNNLIDQEAKNVGFTPTDIQNAKGMFGADPRQNRQVLLQNSMANLQAQQALDAAVGTNVSVNNGQSIQGGTQAPAAAGGAITPTGPQTAIGFPSRGQLATQETGIDANGNTTSVPLVTRLQQQGVGGLAGPAGQPSAPSPFGTGRIPPALRNPNAPGAPQAQQGQQGPAQGGAMPANVPAPGAPPGAVTTGLSPATSAAMATTGQGSAQALQADARDASGYGTRIFQLNKALSGLQGAGTTGPGSDSLNHAASFLQTVAPSWLSANMPGVDPSKIADFDTANKYLTAYASSQAGSMGAGTDSKLATALSANASTHISNLAAQDVVKANIALERMKQAQVKSFYGSGVAPENYSRWAANWQNNADPRAYAVDLMTPQARAQMIGRMSPGERANFLSQVRSSLQSGLVDQSQLGGGGN